MTQRRKWTIIILVAGMLTAFLLVVLPTLLVIYYWDELPVSCDLYGFYGGAPAASSQNTTVRLVSHEVQFHLRGRTYSVDSVSRFYNTGDTRSEWVGFPKRGSYRTRYPSGTPEFALEGWVNGEKVVFKEERKFTKDIKYNVIKWGVKIPQKIIPFHYCLKKNRWFYHYVEFPSRSETLIRSHYTAHYVRWPGLSPLQIRYCLGTASTWRDSIARISFTLHCPDQKRIKLEATSLPWSKTRKKDGTWYELSDIKPKPGKTLIILISWPLIRIT